MSLFKTLDLVQRAERNFCDFMPIALQLPDGQRCSHMWNGPKGGFGRRAGTRILRPHMVSGNCYGAALSINPVVFYNLPSPSTPCSCSCDFLSSCLTTSQSTSIDDHYPLLDLLGYSRYGPYGSILAIVGSKRLFSGDTACSLAIYIKLSGRGGH